MGIEDHPQYEKILADIMSGDSTREIGARYGINFMQVQRHRKAIAPVERVPAPRKNDPPPDVSPPPRSNLVPRREQHPLEPVIAKRCEATIPAIQQLGGTMETMRKLYAACDDYLRDPEDSTRYNLFPRAWELDVVYQEGESKALRRASLQTLLDRIGAEDKQAVEVVTRVEDPRKLIIQTAGAITKQLELLARLEGSITDQVNIVTQVSLNQDWTRIKAIILEELQDHPELLERIARRLADA